MSNITLSSVYSTMNADEAQHPTEVIRRKERYKYVHCSRGFRILSLSVCDIPLLGNYEAYSDNSLPTFWDSLSVPPSILTI